MQIYQLKLVLRGISPQIWRRVLVDADTSLAELHCVTQIVMGWEDCHLHRFRIHGKDFGSTHPGGIVFSDDSQQVRLSQFRLRPGERFLYEYDFTDRRRLDVRLEAVLPAEPQQVYPVCTAGKYACPPDECSGVEDYLAYRCLLWATQEQDMEVLAEFAVQVAQRQPDDPEHREAIEQHIKDALTHDYPEHHHGQLVVIVTDCSPVPHLEGHGEGERESS